MTQSDASPVQLLLPGLAGLDLGATPVVAAGAPPVAGRHVRVSPAHVSRANVAGAQLTLAVAPGDEDFACAMVAAFAAPDRPAAADPASRDLLALARRVAGHPVSVLIEGETGTGKEGLARLVHDSSPRRDCPLVAVNCAALPEAMLEAILFGHERGAFTGAAGAGQGLFRAADGGSLFLDEIAELPLPLQAKLLRAIQEREVLPIGATKPVRVDVRIIAAAGRSLAEAVAAGRFRADLYYRLAVFPLATLPLHRRPADIPAIAAHWLLRRAEGPLPWLTPAALARLAQHPWPGNVRELGNVLDRAVILSGGGDIGPEQLVFDTGPQAIRLEGALPQLVRAHEANAIQRAIAETESRRAAARRLGISERTLRYKLAASRGQPATVQ